MVDSPDNTQEQDKPKVWDHNQFRDRIIRASNGYEITQRELPEQIDLGGGLIGRRCDDIMQETLGDPEKKERLLIGVVNKNNKLAINDKPYVGSATMVTLE